MIKISKVIYIYNFSSHVQPSLHGTRKFQIMFSFGICSSYPIGQVRDTFFVVGVVVIFTLLNYVRFSFLP